MDTPFNMKERIAIIGGSNSISRNFNGSYLYGLQKFGLNVTNFAVGDTNSAYGLVQLLKHKILERYDILIFEYFVNDSNQFLSKLYTTYQAESVLNTIQNLCVDHNVKLLPVFIYNRKHYNANRYEDSAMVKLWSEFVKRAELHHISMFDVLRRELGDRWDVDGYRDNVHLNPKGMQMLAAEIRDNIVNARVPVRSSIRSDGQIKLISIEEHMDTKNFKNSLIDVEYHEVLDVMELEFDLDTEVYALEYLCDLNSGYISIETSAGEIHKQALRTGKFIHERKKTQLCNMTFSIKDLPVTRRLKIKIIDRPNKKLYLKGWRDFPGVCSESPTFKIVSLLVKENTK